ncbi:MAG: iron ABC transporter permease [Patescibacteria group bacterium]|nr:iron ABC transporter permease [Patescibacteria group bacterium]
MHDAGSEARGGGAANQCELPLEGGLGASSSSLQSSRLVVQYARSMRRKMLFGGVLLCLTAAVAAVSLQTGAYPIGLGELLQAVVFDGDEATSHVLWRIRMPQVAAAPLAGACLGLSGAAMQNVLRNPLASPFTLGVSQGAVFGATFAIIVLGTGTAVVGQVAGGQAASGEAAGWLAAGWLAATSSYVLVACAFAGSLATVGAIVLLSSLRNLSPAALILAGVALSAFFGSATMLLQYFASDSQIASAVFWTFGDLRKAQWSDLALIALVLLPIAAFLVWRAWDFNAMTWGDDTARSLGVRVSSLRLTALVLAALAASVTTAFVGVIGFVGLIAPHMMRMAIGEDHRFLFPYAALAGGLLLLVADLLARTVMAPVVLPVGILTSFAGGPVFLYLLLKHGNVRS